MAEQSGLLAPWQGLNASFSPVPIHRGKLAFISQSAAVSNTVLDWAQQRAIWVSYFIALGDSIDIDVDDMLDFLARNGKTSAILLHLEHLSDARRFLSAARSAVRNKPILVIKSGRTIQAQRLLNYPPGLDAAYDAAIQRAGLLLVRDTHELFSAVETLSYMRTLGGERLMIISNGIAAAALARAPLGVNNRQPAGSCRRCTPERYRAALLALLGSKDYDALLIIHAPSAGAADRVDHRRRYVNQMIRQALDKGITRLETHDVRPLVEAYGIKTLPTWIAANSDAAGRLSEGLCYPVALKLRSADIAHKSDVQGVMLALRNATEVAQAASAMLERASVTYLDARASKAWRSKAWLAAPARRSCASA